MFPRYSLTRLEHTFNALVRRVAERIFMALCIPENFDSLRRYFFLPEMIIFSPSVQSLHESLQNAKFAFKSCASSLIVLLLYASLRFAIFIQISSFFRRFLVFVLSGDEDWEKALNIRTFGIFFGSFSPNSLALSKTCSLMQEVPVVCSNRRILALK